MQSHQRIDYGESPGPLAERAQALQEMLHDARLRTLTLQEIDALKTLAEALHALLDTHDRTSSVKFDPGEFAT